MRGGRLPGSPGALDVLGSARGDNTPRTFTLTVSLVAERLTYSHLSRCPGLRLDRCHVLPVANRRAGSVVQTAPSDPVDCGPENLAGCCPVALESVGFAEYLGLG